MKVRYRRRALADIEDVFDYLNERSPRAATEVVARIRSAADRLSEWPRMGHSGRVALTYEWVVVRTPYVIVYEIDEAAGEVAIIAVFHGAQDRDNKNG